MFAILGSGFGLYGYLPALVDGCAQRIVLTERSRSRFCERTELDRFATDIEWVNDDDAALRCVDGVVLALPPVNQSEWITKSIARSNIKFLLLEKPLAHTPDAASAIFDDLICSKKVFRIGYTFRYTGWGKKLLTILENRSLSATISIDWSFLAHHFRYDLSNWKRFSNVGGGTIRFYGIHIIALLAEAGYSNVLSSDSFGSSLNEIVKWRAVFAGVGLPECTVIINTKSYSNMFSIKYTKPNINIPSELVNLNDPFESHADFKIEDNDHRVDVLAELCRSLNDEKEIEYAWYERTISLWHSIEKLSKFKHEH